MAASLMFMLPVIVLFFLAQKVFIEGVTLYGREGVVTVRRMRVALFGCGWIQDFHARGVLAHRGTNWSAVANHREETARAFAERYGIDASRPTGRRWPPTRHRCASSSPPRTRCTRRRRSRCCEAGKHVLVEKPMATSVEECDAMMEAARASGASLMVAHCWRFRAEVIALRDRIAAGELGEVVKTRGYGVHARLGSHGLVHRSRARRRRRAPRHGRARDRHCAIPAGRPRAGPGVRRRSAPGTATVRGRRRRHPADRVVATARTAWSNRAGGTRTRRAWRPTPRCTARRATRASGPREEPERGLRALHATDVLGADAPSSWARSRRAGSHVPAGRTGGS